MIRSQVYWGVAITSMVAIVLSCNQDGLPGLGGALAVMLWVFMVVARSICHLLDRPMRVITGMDISTSKEVATPFNFQNTPAAQRRTGGPR